MKRSRITSRIGWHGLLAAVLTLAAGTALQAEDVALRDVAPIEGPQAAQLVGYGVVVGLRGSGDRDVSACRLMLARELKNPAFCALEDGAELLAGGDAVEVLITASLQPLAACGDPFDVEVHAVGDARSLSGGRLLRVALVGPDGKTHAYARGKLTAPPETGATEAGAPLRAIVPDGGVISQQQSGDSGHATITESIRVATLTR